MVRVCPIVIGLDEARVLTLAQAGDPSAFVEVFAAFRARVYGYLCRCGLDAATRDDLVQDIFMKIHAGLPRVRADKPLRAWIFTIVANTVRSHFRKKPVQQLVTDDRVVDDAFGDIVAGETA